MHGHFYHIGNKILYCHPCGWPNHAPRIHNDRRRVGPVSGAGGRAKTGSGAKEHRGFFLLSSLLLILSLGRCRRAALETASGPGRLGGPARQGLVHFIEDISHPLADFLHEGVAGQGKV